jgi:hypothetical protein
MGMAAIFAVLFLKSWLGRFWSIISFFVSKISQLKLI